MLVTVGWMVTESACYHVWPENARSSVHCTVERLYRWNPMCDFKAADRIGGAVKGTVCSPAQNDNFVECSISEKFELSEARSSE